jgi:hypothetical protein
VLDSVPGEGTIATVTFPAARIVAAKEERAPPAMQQVLAAA